MLIHITWRTGAKRKFLNKQNHVINFKKSFIVTKQQTATVNTFTIMLFMQINTNNTV